MKVAIIGAGGMGGGFARALAGAHDVAIGSRDPERGAKLAADLGAASGGSYADATRDAEVVFLAVPWPSIDDTLAQAGDLAGKVVVDITNPYVGGELRPHEDTSNAEEIQARAPGARVVKGWNTVFSPIVNTGADFGGTAASVFLAGDDPDAKRTVATLAREMGFDPIDTGPLEKARDLERLMTVLGTLGGAEAEWGSWAIKILRR